MGFPFLADGVKMTVSGAPGTGAITLGAAVSGFQSLSGAGAPNGAVLPCYITDTGNAWEFSLCTYNSGTVTLTRQVLWSSNANAAVNLTSAALVSMTIFAEHLNNLYDGGLDNPFHNPGCNVAQRGTGAITVTTAGGFALDGWWILPTGASVTAQQAGSIGSSLHSLQITGAASVTGVSVYRRIESLIAAPFAGQTAVIQFKVKNNSGASITPTVYIDYPTATDNFGATTNSSSVNAQACANGATTLCAVAVGIPSAATAGLQVRIALGALGAAATVQISEIDLVLAPNAAAGLVSLPPTVRLASIPSDLERCQRYYELTGTGKSGAWASSTTPAIGGAWIAPKRATPTVSLTTTSPVVNEPGIGQFTGSGSAWSPLSTSSLGFYGTMSGFSGATSGGIAIMNGDYIAASAEL